MRLSEITERDEKTARKWFQSQQSVFVASQIQRLQALINGMQNYTLIGAQTIYVNGCVQADCLQNKLVHVLNDTKMTDEG